MNRKKFIRTCGLACIGSAAWLTFMPGCGSSRFVTGTITGSNLVVPLSSFEFIKNKKRQFKKYIIVHHDLLQYPVCVYRQNGQHFTALWMRCTHQGTELQVFGDKLQCPAHGSEFDQDGKVTKSPALTDLRTFPVMAENNEINILIK